MRLLFIIMLLLVSPVNCLAGYLGEALQEKMINSNASDEIPVIVYFKTDATRNASYNSVRNQLKTLKGSDFKDKKAFKKARKAMRREYIESMKSEADFSSRQFKKVLRKYKKNFDRELWLVNALAVKLQPHLINIFSNHPQVDHIDLDAVIKLTANNVSASNSPPEWNLDLVKAPSLWDEDIIGAGIVIASMDTGVDAQHPDLAPGWRGGTNSWFDPYSEHPLTPHDGIGHGTQVMGVMLGGDASGSSIGVAPGAKWISVKIFKDDATAWLSAIHAGFQWLLDPDGIPSTDDAPDIVNNSWGLISSQSCNTEFHADVDALKLAGIEVVFAAGNAGPLENSLHSPADYAEVVSVGSVDEYMNVANTSSRGPSNCSTGFFPNLAAPGVGIYTSDLSPFGALYTIVDGTSFAAPHLSGIIALLKSAVPTASHDDIRSALYSSAVDLGAPGQDNVTGYGMVDAYQALLKLRCPTGEMDSDGDGWYDACDNCITYSNKSQLDSDGDVYGNICDADLNNDNTVNLIDFGLFRSAYGTTDPDADFNGDGSVNLIDFGIFRSMYGNTPGPSGIVN